MRYKSKQIMFVLVGLLAVIQADAAVRLVPFKLPPCIGPTDKVELEIEQIGISTYVYTLTSHDTQDYGSGITSLLIGQSDHAEWMVKRNNKWMVKKDKQEPNPDPVKMESPSGWAGDPNVSDRGDIKYLGWVAGRNRPLAPLAPNSSLGGFIVVMEEPYEKLKSLPFSVRFAKTGKCLWGRVKVAVPKSKQSAGKQKSKPVELPGKTTDYK